MLDIDHGRYRLNGDLVCPDNPLDAAVTITGERVRFNLGGYTITRDDVTGRFLMAGIVVRGADAHISWGSVVDIACPGLGDRHCTGIRLREAPGARIIGMALHNNTQGIASSGFGGIVGNANGARIYFNDITGNLRAGIALSSFGGATAEGAVIAGNDLSDTGGFSPGGQGFLGVTDGVSLIGNVANNCAAAGILLFGDEALSSAERNTVRDNTTLNNGGSGIALVGDTEAFRPRDNLVQSNTSFGNTRQDLVEAVVGEGPAADCLNTWKDNHFDFAAPDCIE
ncbi:MAG: right-handed parallel beta-helix repeat-containing protein [Myxococcota bacterium]|nr:right-handed parallel beta-helix repeat-containing protein [Myxococcota bacterium]